MQFRERRRVIQVIRTVYDPAVKRGRSEVVGKIDKDALGVPEKLRKACTQAELTEIEDWLARRETTLRTETIRDDTGALSERMRHAADYFREHATGSTGDEQAAVHAADIWLAWDDLKKAMRKAGYPQSKLAEDKKNQKERGSS
ncbi:hypothetical protein N825_15935 [Skermanella stibiiresistens SB22]|uniref:Uncharacterized protein n=1 Tax=Skermanella stibiiresistens SB22 TaxID=1385369 RepID=W9GZ57_9PROT|nr:hypothetical protein [Skermanella stibiiresistens]EWY37891.1 hypothetical protein N825_15935 [Skermanella stibiiresistens SB22]